MQTSRFTNIAFISYKREDEEWARWLQSKLEHYKLPTEITKENPDLEFKDRPRHVFKDTTDLSGGVLAKAIKEGLESSKYLVVICSPRAAKSPWVCKEVQEFIDSGREEYIIPFIIDGEPNSKDPEKECFPSALKSLSGERELLGININENGRDSAAVKVVARMFGLRFDTLWDRFQREAKRKRTFIIGGLIAFLALMLLVLCIIFSQYRKTQENLIKFVAEKVYELIDQGDSYLAKLIVLDISSPDNSILKYSEVYEADDALYSSYYNESAILYHPGEVSSCSVSADDKYIASGCEDGIIRIWDINTGTVLKKLPGHTDYVCSVYFSRDGKFLVSTSVDKSIILWDVRDGKIIKKYKGHQETTRHAIITKDNKYIISSSNDQTIKIWNVKSGKVIRSFSCDYSIDYPIAYDCKNNRVAYLNSSKIIVCSLNDFKIQEYPLSISPSQFPTLSFFHDANAIIYGGSTTYGLQNLICLCDLSNGNVKTLNEPKFRQWYQTLNYSNHENLILAVEDNDIAVIYPNGGEEIYKLHGHLGTCNDAFFLKDGRIVSASQDKTLRIWASLYYKKFQAIRKTVYYSGTYDNNFLVDTEGNVNVADSKGKTVSRLFKVKGDADILAVSNTCRFVAIRDICPIDYSCNLADTLFVDDGSQAFEDAPDTIQIASRKKTLKLVNKSKVEQCLFTPDEQKLLLRFSDSVKIVNLDNTSSTAIPFLKKDLTEMAINNSGNIMAVGTAKGKIIVYDIHQHKIVNIINAHNDMIKKISFDKNDNLLSTSYNESEHKLWKLSNKRYSLNNSINVSNGWMPMSTISSNGRWIIILSSQNNISVWDAYTGKNVANWQIEEREGLVTDIHFTADNGRIIANIGKDEVIVIDWPTKDVIINKLRNRFSNRSLTNDERKKFHLE